MSDLISQNLNMIFKTPKGETVHALKDLNFTLKKGELLTVLGPSGCGKTTLLNITAGFIKPTSGSITLNNNEINKIIDFICIYAKAQTIKMYDSNLDILVRKLYKILQQIEKLQT